MKFSVIVVLLSVLATGWSECPVYCRENCHCRSEETPGGHSVDQTPQFVMPTFDDGVNVVNFELYKKLFQGTKFNKGNQCPIHATFYVSHDYTNYKFVHDLYKFGNDIAVHTISHLSSTEYWKNLSYAEWKQELGGMKTILSDLAQIPEDQIVGSRAPFLQTSGDNYFRALKDSGFEYDSSMPSRAYTKRPMWPYTLDNGFDHDCQIEPCPKEYFPGMWLVPMINWNRKNFVCAMADACVPAPTTAEDTFEYFKDNFYRHYQSNKAPFPLFLHQAWLQHELRLEGYVMFLDWLLTKEDVFIASAKEVIDYVRNPVSLDEYSNRPCLEYPLLTNCKGQGKVCFYKQVPPGGDRYMTRCGECSIAFPWVGNAKGN